MKQTALITGASSGIGRECAIVFAKNGFDLILVARSVDKLSALKEELEQKHGIAVTVIPMDLSEPDVACELLRQLKKLELNANVLVNSAGFGDFAGFLDSDWSKQKNMVDLNITALMQMSYVFGNEMRKCGYGRILNLSSVAAFSAGPYMSVYYASKAFVLSFSQALAEELKDTGVTVTALCPGPTSTGFDSAADMGGSKMFDTFKSATPKQVAECGYQAVMSGKHVKYHGLPTKLMNIGSRIVPRKTTTKFAAKINGVPQKGAAKDV